MDRAALRSARLAGLLCTTWFGFAVGVLACASPTPLATTPAAASPVALQQAGVTPAQDRPVQATPEQPAPATSEGDDGLPDPGFWKFDEDGHARDWLDKPPMDPADLRARLPEYADTLEDHGIFLDLEAREMFVRGATIHDARSLGYPIEYLVVTELGRTYEALVMVRAQPSVLAACLQAMGLEPGGPTRMVLKDPLPPEADLDAGTASAWMVHPPHGPLMQLTMEWLDDGGKQHAPSLESLIIDARTGEPLADVGWIFTGGSYGEYRHGRGTARRFKADVEGDVVAIYLAGLEVCIFERNSMDGLIDGYYFPHPELMPPPNTPITLRFKLLDESVPVRESFSAPTPLEMEALYEEELQAVQEEGEGASPDEGGAGSVPGDAPDDGGR